MMTPFDTEGISFECLHCGGHVFAKGSGEFGHSWPTCEAFDAVQDYADAADFLREHRLAYSART